MALVVSAETARAQIISLAQQAEASGEDFMTFVAAKPPTSLSMDHRKVRIEEITTNFRALIRSFARFSKEFDAIKSAHQHLPEWNGNNQGRFTDRNALSSLFSVKVERVDKVLYEMTGIVTKADEEFNRAWPHDNVPLFAELAPSF